MKSLHNSTLKFEPYPALEALNPGITPLEFNVLVLTRRVAEKQGAIFIPDGAKTREEEAGDEGLLVAKSAAAGGEIWTDETAPRVGDPVMFARYAGKTFVGADGRLYRLMKDKEILGARAPA